MENIFIDTSVFVAENFLEGKRINELFRLIEEGHFKNVMPLITINEIKNQYGKRVNAAIKIHNEAMNNYDLDVLRNYSEGAQILKKFPKARVLITEFNTELDKRFHDAAIEIISYPTLDTTSIFDKYFKGEKPFGKGDKKKEFPDAFALESLIQWCEKKNKDCIVLSLDKDFIEFKHLRLHIEPDYKAFLDKTLKRLENEKMHIVDKIYKNKIRFIENKVELWLKDKLDDTTIYNDYTNWMDVHDIHIESVIVSINDYQVTQIEDENIQLEIMAKAKVNIDLVIDDEEYAYRDSDDGNIYYPSTTKRTYKLEFELPVMADLIVTSKDNYDSNITISKINDGKDPDMTVDSYEYM